ncbi:ATP-binding protein [Candidatus Magnetobacterium casense]|uniref:histidine kinase n=1 Tax=Candidatus Magnetobacterium casense TaxID=1455061 RepID=A0ABS6RU82_9BACT|nr:ATP-binding protein [Candidatus Magnetobacterium casensis]MBV6340190.1 PAS domain-containing protein [Candidatus Magnetobacterium casensis]
MVLKRAFTKLFKPEDTLSIFQKAVVLTILLIDLFVAGMGALYLNNSKRKAEQKAAVTSQNLTRVLEQYIGGFIDKIDLVLVDIADDLKNKTHLSTGNGDRVTLLLAKHQQRLPTLESLRVTDAEGIVRYGLGVTKDSKTNVSDMDYFIAAHGSAKSSLTISKPIFARISKKWVIALARRIDNPDGTFNGVVYANIALEHLIHSFASIDVGPHGGISLRDKEMAVIARYPQPKEIGSDIGGKNISPELRRLFEAGQPSGTFFTPTSFDNTPKYVSYRKISPYPLYIVVGIAASDYLEEWRHERIVTIMGVIIFIIGTVIFLSLVHIYIIYRKKAENTLKESRNLLQSIIDNTTAVIFLKDTEGRYLLINSQYEMLFHITKEAISGKTDHDIFPKAAADSFRANDMVVLEQRKSLNFEEIVPHEDGIHTYISVKFPLFDINGHAYAVCGIATDISERKLMEEELNRKTTELEFLTGELEQRMVEEVNIRLQKEQLLIQQSKMAALGEMIGMIAHQWKQPLNALSANIFDIKDAYEYGELNKEYMDDIVRTSKEQINFMIRTIDDFKNFLLPVKEKTLFNVKHVIDDILYMFGGIYKKNNIEITIETFGTESNIYGYPSELTQAFLNIINNSRDAIISRRDKQVIAGRINIVIYETEGHVIVKITDNGGGIPDDIKDKIFEPYFTTKGKKGAGIGLYMSKTIIEMNMGGSLSVRNVEDGVEFTITLTANLKEI